ncbi:MAG TPA: DinB family protein [Gemmatimonadaceae bacterium]|nr:DinB family protein [Gemmatimonadaceae bacterium]
MPATRAVVALALLTALATPAVAQQQASRPDATGLAADLLKDLGDLEKKMTDLARAIPADKYAWRPSAGTRSVGEVLRHVAADNYLLPALLGHVPDPSTGIRGDDYKTAVAFEQRALDRDQTLAQLDRSFAFMKQALAGTTPARMGEAVSLFGQPSTVQYTWILTATHLHEHLGQLIAYARSNGVVPPWSK